MTKKPAPVCPTCGQPASVRDTSYGKRFGCCGLWAWGYYPLADAKTHDARRAAHAAFDPIWRSGRLSRSAAYQRLAGALGVDVRDCHMKLMDETTARRAWRWAREFRGIHVRRTKLSNSP